MGGNEDLQDVQRIELEEISGFGKNVAEGKGWDLTEGLAVIISHAIFYLIIDLIHYVSFH